MDRPAQVLCFRGIARRVVPGLVALIVAIWFYDFMAPNPVESFCLLKWGRPAKAKIADAYEDFQEEEAGDGYWFGVVTYEFVTESGERVTSSTRHLRGGLPEEWLDEKRRPESIDIEYFPNLPRWNRLHGTGSDGFFDWLWRHALLGTAMLVLFLSPGVALLKNGIAEIRTALAAPADERKEELTWQERHENRVWLFGWILGIDAALVLLGILARPLVPLVLSLAQLAVVAFVYVRVRG
jgi:hypothetical protein